jgi:hypothetical protein
MLHILSWGRRPFVQASCLAAILLAGCSGNPKSQPPAASANPANSASTANPANTADNSSEEAHPEVVPVQPAEANRDVVPVEGPIPLEPPDGKWLTDEFGRRYFVHKIAKVPQSWIWLEEGKKVQLIRGLQFDVVSYDEKSFDVKIYGTDARMAADIATAQKQRTTPEDLAKAAATYKVNIAASDRLLLTPFSQGLPQRGQWRNGFAVADINEDGKADIVHGPPRKGGSRPAIFLGDGKGTWRPWAEASFPAIPFDYGDVAVADFNGDRHPDLAIASHLRGITVLVGDGKGRFSAWSQGIEFQGGEPDTPIFSSRAVEAVDWNGDGRTDLLAWGEGPRLAAARIQGGGGGFSTGSRGAVVYLNQGNGTWQKVAAGPKGDRSYGDAVAVADFNGDGRPDFATSSALSGNRTIFYLNQEDGSWKSLPIAELRPQATFRGVAAGDFDRDGRMDLAVGYSSNELGVARTGIDVLFSRADGSWERRGLGLEENRNGIWALAAGDLDGDGALDLAGITGAGGAWIFLGDGKGGFTREQSPELGGDIGCTGYHAALADLDGDGVAELIAGYAGEATVSPLGTVIDTCKSGGSLRAWKASRQGGR